MEQQVIKNKFFVAVITNDFIKKSDENLHIIKGVEAANNKATQQDRSFDLKPMYVIVKRGIFWRDFQKFSWRQIHFYSTDAEFDKAFDEIKQDVKNWKKIQT